MKSSPLVVAIVSLLFGIGYGVLFKQIYPLVPIDSGIVSLCAILGFTTSLAGIGAWKVVTKVAISKRKDEKIFGLISQPTEPDSRHRRTTDDHTHSDADDNRIPFDVWRRQRPTGYTPRPNSTTATRARRNDGTRNDGTGNDGSRHDGRRAQGVWRHDEPPRYADDVRADGRRW
jgi:hypothetical protein